MMKGLAMKKGGSILHNKMAEMQRKRVITESDNEKKSGKRAQMVWNSG